MRDFPDDLTLLAPAPTSSLVALLSAHEAATGAPRRARLAARHVYAGGLRAVEESLRTAGAALHALRAALAAEEEADVRAGAMFAAVDALDAASSTHAHPGDDAKAAARERAFHECIRADAAIAAERERHRTARAALHNAMHVALQAHAVVDEAVQEMDALGALADQRRGSSGDDCGSADDGGSSSGV